jgi:hypothetical protein
MIFKTAYGFPLFYSFSWSPSAHNFVFFLRTQQIRESETILIFNFTRIIQTRGHDTLSF